MELNPIAIKIATKLIKASEGCVLWAYPDPSSDLYSVLSAHGMLKKLQTGKLLYKDLPSNFKALDSHPATIGYGETQNVKMGDVWDQATADARLEYRVKVFMQAAIAISPKLASLSPEKIAAVTSLIYNIGNGQYKTSTVARKIQAGDLKGAADAFLLFNKSGGKVNQGLVNRRKVERDLFLSVS